MSNTLSTGARPPVPAPSELTRPFWDAAKDGRLDIQRCSNCSLFIHPPEPQCSRCHSSRLAWSPVSGRGTIYGFTVMHVPLVEGFEDVVPYTCVAVELEEQPGLIAAGNLIGSPPDSAMVGAAVELVFEEIDDGYRLPQFRLAV
jgi:uncharacterized protein